MITDRYTLYSFYANLLLTLVIVVLAVSVISKQDAGLKKLNELYVEYGNSNKRHISCTEFKTYMDELGVEVVCDATY